MKKTILILIVSLLISNFFIFVMTEFEPIASKYRYTEIKLGRDLSENLGEITSDIEIRQSFVANSDNLSGINLFVSTFNRENKGNIILNILDDSSNILRTSKVDFSELRDNKYFQFNFPLLRNIKNKVFFISITSDSIDSNNAVTIWKDQRQIKNTLLFLNKETTPGTLVGSLIFENIMDMKTRVIINIVVLILNLLTLKLFLFLKRR